jgi:hypothetical protein
VAAAAGARRRLEQRQRQQHAGRERVVRLPSCSGG